jgi:hypothetical protein
VMYRKQEGGIEISQTGNYTDNHACDVWQNTLLVTVSRILYHSLKMHTILSWPTMEINRQWIQKMNFGRDGYLQNFLGAYLQQCKEQISHPVCSQWSTQWSLESLKMPCRKLVNFLILQKHLAQC